MFAVWLKRDLETFNTYIVRLFSLSRSGAQGRTCCRWTSIVLNLQLVDQINQWETNIHKGRIHNLNFLKSAHIVLIKSPADLSLPAFTMLTSEKVLLKLKLINWLIISHHEKIWIFLYTLSIFIIIYVRQHISTACKTMHTMNFNLFVKHFSQRTVYRFKAAQKKNIMEKMML